MTAPPAVRTPPAFSPELAPADALAAYWLGQVTLRLRREVSWIWHQRGVVPSPERGALPPPSDRALEALDLARYSELKRRFFAEDETARFLSEKIAAPEPQAKPRARGSFSWVVRKLALEPVERFVFALALSPSFDSAAGSVIAACSNDAALIQPSLALAQRLWDEPAEVLAVTDPEHQLYRLGLVGRNDAADSGQAGVGWREALAVSTPVVRQLLFPGSGPPAPLRPLVVPEGGRPPVEAARLGPEEPDGLRVVPVLGPRGAEHGVAAAAVGRRPVEAFDGAPTALARPGLFDALAASCWLRGVDLFLDLDATAALMAQQPARLPSPAIPLRLFLAAESAGELARVPGKLRLPPLKVPRLSYPERVELWRRELGPRAGKLAPTIAELARRFRFEAGPIRAICRELDGHDAPSPGRLAAACRAELELDLGVLAEEIVPRFSRDELVLPHKQALQLEEIRCAMRSLTEVHYGWGTARAWQEAGIAALFAGPPGTGKTMAAEVLAGELKLPLFRIDLSQVVNKYIGETEKNLKRVFDACEASDLILLFDEADALFGRRTQVRDAHDRYANLEISYLLSRMERAKGLTILTTNRKQDLDDAFLRRLRYVVEFPLPDVAERRRIWEVSLPDGVDAGEVDVAFLADRFQLAGGHIRSAIFNGCLQSAGRAGGTKRRRLEMEDVLVAVARELAKASRTVSLERFGDYAGLVRRLEEAEGETR